MHADTILLAAMLIRSLPDGTPFPDCAEEPDGDMSLDWMVDRNHILSLSIGRTSRIPYAWVQGSQSGHGVADFDGQHFPAELAPILQAIMGPQKAEE